MNALNDTIVRLRQAELRQQAEHRRLVRAVRVGRRGGAWLGLRARWARRRANPAAASDDRPVYAARTDLV